MSRISRGLTASRLLALLLLLLDDGMAGDLPLNPRLHPNPRAADMDGLVRSINSVPGSFSVLGATLVNLLLPHMAIMSLHFYVSLYLLELELELDGYVYFWKAI